MMRLSDLVRMVRIDIPDLACSVFIFPRNPNQFCFLYGVGVSNPLTIPAGQIYVHCHNIVSTAKRSEKSIGGTSVEAWEISRIPSKLENLLSGIYRIDPENSHVFVEIHVPALRTATVYVNSPENFIYLSRNHTPSG